MKKLKADFKMLFSLEGLFAALIASAAVGYILFRIDIIPDDFFLIGYLDEVVIILIAFFLLGWVVRRVMGKRSK